MEVLKSASCFLGGDAFDEALGALVERKLREQEDVELPSTEAIAYRLKLKGEEIKKAFATEQGQSISVEFVQGDDCFDLEIAREEFEAACRDRRLFDRFFEFVSDVLRDFPAALRLDGIETVGGNMYIARLGRELLHAVQDRGLEVRMRAVRAEGAGGEEDRVRSGRCAGERPAERREADDAAVWMPLGHRAARRLRDRDGGRAAGRL